MLTLAGNDPLRPRRAARLAATAVIVPVLLVVAGCGGPERAEPTTPEQLAVTQPIRALFSALAADDAVRACAQLTRSARSGRQPVLQGNGWLNCEPRPSYARDHADDGLWRSKVYDVTITGDHAVAEVPWGSDRFSPGWDFSLVRLGDRWLITRIADYNYVGG